ncbi:MAG: XdhC family protein [Gammaproteobacteria bacterium]
MSVRRILESFDAWRREGVPIVLATVYETLGSTYSKAGHRILIAANGDYQGLVSGGCLEGDLAERARAVVAGGAPSAVTYDLRDDRDDLWGLGIGCNGLIEIFLQPLLPGEGYEPFAAIADVLRGTRGGAAATVIASDRDDAPAGATVVLPRGDAPRGYRVESEAALARLADGCREVLETGRAIRVQDGATDVLYTVLKPVPRVLVLGAGLDAVPVVDLAASLGWFVVVGDHRPAYLERGGFARADRVVHIDPAKLPEHVALGDFDAVVVMSHHLETDRKYLEHLSVVPFRYIGVLGPRARRERLLDALGAAGDALRPRLRGPVGLDLGADSPEAIALSIVAEMQAVFSGKCTETASIA